MESNQINPKFEFCPRFFLLGFRDFFQIFLDNTRKNQTMEEENPTATPTKLVGDTLLSFALQGCLLMFFSINYSFSAQPLFFDFMIALQNLNLGSFTREQALSYLQNWFTTNKSRV